MAKGKRPDGAAQAEAQLAVVRSTAGIVLRTLVTVVAIDVLVLSVLDSFGIKQGMRRELSEIVLVTVLALPLLYAMTLRPVTKLAGEHARAAAEARFQAIAQAAGDAIVIVDLDWKLRFANRATEHMFGFGPRQWAGMNITRVLPEDTREFLAAAREVFRATGRPTLQEKGAMELELLRQDGTRFPAEVRVSMLRDADQPEFVVVLRDITTRREAEQELQARTARLNALITNSPLAVVVLDKDQRVQMCNPAFENLFQYRSAEIAGLKLDKLVAPDEQMEEAERMTKRGIGGQASHAITRRRRKDGSLVDVEVHGVPLLIGGQLEGLYAIYQDLTSRKELERVARESELRYQDLFEYANDAIIIFRPRDEVILAANPAACEMYGFSEKEFVGKSLKSLTRDVERGQRKVEQLLREGKTRGFETIQFRKDGRPMHLLGSGSVITYQGGPAIMGVMHDITERKQAEESLRASEKKFREMLESLPVPVRIIQDEKLVFANIADARLHGYNAPEEQFQVDDAAFIAPEDLERVREYGRRRALGEDVPRRYEVRRFRRDGGKFVAEINAERIIYEGAPASLLALHDLTEQRKIQMYEQLLPVCCVCGKIRDDSGVEAGTGAWDRLDHYIARHSDAKLSHTFCPECFEGYREKEGLK
ncbi:MAG: PAS domain S-box protein [Acidobacteria bacterium]|nr:PAS domain S-box protein [Acidobacteriota bacterium]